MLDYTRVICSEITVAQLAEGVTPHVLRHETNLMVDRMLGLIATCDDAAVVFQPVDPEAHDAHAVDAGAVDLAWTLGHVVVHATASSEEAAFLAAELARGVPAHGRSRYETDWTTVTTIAQCRQRLNESRRIRLASLELWPDQPHLDNTCAIWEGGPIVNAVSRFLYGLVHDARHLGQIGEIVRQVQVQPRTA